MTKNTQVVVLNASMEPLAVVPLRRAMAFLIRERADIIQAVPGETIRAAQAEFPLPLVVAFREMVRVPYRHREAPWSRARVLARDNRVCAYCGGRGHTIDHILPKSRGGQETWLNTVTACARCNQQKANRTPEEAGMSLRFQPRVVVQRDTLILAVAATGADLAQLGLA